MKLRTWCIRMGQILTKTVLVFTGFLIFLILFKPAISKAEDDRGGITIRQQNAPIEKVFQSIERQSGYRFFYNETLLQGAGKVTLNLQNVSLQDALEACFLNQPLSYAIVDKTIIVKKRQEQQPKAPEAAAVALSRPGKIIALRGKVTSNKVPVAGASIMIKGTENGVSSDKEGLFTLSEVEDDATLIISSVSHTAREVQINGQTFISIDLSQKSDDLDEALVVAYNTTTVKRNTAAVTVVKGEQIATLPNRSFDKSLQGLVPGLQITQGTGQPGGGVASFVLRGISTGGNPDNASTVRNPLIVIDGIPVSQEPAQIRTSNTAAVNNPMSQLNPSDIESISVLKDAAAVALYGSKASNGVILITTKRGKAGKTVFNFRHQTDFSTRLKGKLNTLSQDEYLELLYEAYKNSNSARTDAWIKADLNNKFPYQVNAPGDTSFYPVSDWMSEVYDGRAATIINELSMSGGSERTNFYMSLEWTKQNGVAKASGFDRKSIRFNFENRPANWIKLGFNTAVSYNEQDYAGLGDFAPLSSPAIMSPLNPARKEDGTYFFNYLWGLTYLGKELPNPAADADYNIKSNKSLRGLSKLYAEIKPIRDFTLSSTVGFDFMLTEAKEKIDPRFGTDAVNIGLGMITESDIKRPSIINTNILRYDKILGRDHSIGVLLGQESQIITERFLSATKTKLSNVNTDQLYGAATITAATGNITKQTLMSFFSQANYGFKDRYFLSGSIRKDGSSRFGKNERFGSAYWSLGASWVISEEPFMKGITNWVNYLKVRGSMGPSGNSAAVLDFYRYDKLNQYTFLGNNAFTPIYTDIPGNPSIQWEETFSRDLGLEMRLFKDKIGFTADLYTKKTSNLIDYVNVPLATGYSKMYDNVGDLQNKGVELSLSLHVIKYKDFRWDILANWSKNVNKLTKAFYPVTYLSIGYVGNEEGRNYNSFFMPTWAGVEESTGKPMWVDSTGKNSSIFNAAKKEFVGKPQPDGFGSVTSTFSYKGITLSAMLYYSYGFQIFDNAKRTLLNDGTNAYINQSREALDRWQKPGDIATNPRRMLNSSADRGTEPSTRYLYDGDFIRLSNVSLSYALPKKLIDRIKINQCRVFVQGHNLASWTKYPGNDPENSNAVGVNSFAYPLQRSYSVGLNVGF